MIQPAAVAEPSVAANLSERSIGRAASFAEIDRKVGYSSTGLVNYFASGSLGFRGHRNLSLIMESRAIMTAMVRVPKIESIKQEQKRFLRDFDRQVAEIDRKRAEEQSKPKPAKNDNSTA